MREIWNEFARWNRVKDSLPEGERLFHTEVNHMTVWVVEDEVAFTLMYPEDY